MKSLKSVIAAPSKEEAERMVKIAYYIDKKFLRPMDVVDLGIDLYRLKECGEVRMSKSPVKLKPHTAAIWGRMTETMRTMFLWSYFCQGIDELRGILSQLEPAIKNTRNEGQHLEAALASLAQKLPQDLKEKFKEGFGREWR